MDSFLQVNGLIMNTPLPLPDIVMPKEGAFGERCLMSEGPPNARNRPMSMDLNEDNNFPIVTSSNNSGSKCIEVRRARRGNFFVLKGEDNDDNSVSLILRIVDENGECLFTFYKNHFSLKQSNICFHSCIVPKFDCFFVRARRTC